jgi:hypothetical protein
MSETRPCLVKCKETKWEGGIGRDVTVHKKAIFHRFSDDKGYADDAAIAITTAIVEFEDGQLQKVDPNLVKFTDKTDSHT